MKSEHEFTLIIDGIPELTSAIVDALVEAGCDDATLMMHAGRITMDFDREAPTLKDAILSAIRDVQKANIGARVLGVEVSEPSSIQEVEVIEDDARRLIGA